MRTLAFILALALSTSAHAWPTPQAAIAEFLKLELDGGRLRAWDISKYLAVDAGYDEPGWDMAQIVRSATVKSLRCGKASCVAEVLFTFEPTAKFSNTQVVPHPQGGSEVISYNLVLRGKQWLLSSSQGMPKPSMAAYVRVTGREL